MLICNPFGFGVLSKTATFGWLFNTRINKPEQCAKTIKYTPTFFMQKRKGGISLNAV